jgi:hypothetical protein
MYRPGARQFGRFNCGCLFAGPRISWESSQELPI